MIEIFQHLAHVVGSHETILGLVRVFILIMLVANLHVIVVVFLPRLLHTRVQTMSKKSFVSSLEEALNIKYSMII